MRTIHTEELEYNQYESPEAGLRAAGIRVLPDGTKVRTVPMGRVVEEMVHNFRSLGRKACPYYSDILERCAYDEISDLINQVQGDTIKAQMHELLRQVVPVDRAHEAIQRCGTGVACDGTPIAQTAVTDMRKQRQTIGVQL